MLLAKKVRLIPTPEQEILFWKSAGVARWAYNYFLSEQDKVYKEYVKQNKTGKSFVKEGEVRKYINQVLKKTTHTWLKEVSSNVMKQGVKDANEAWQHYFKGLAEKPKFKSKHRSTPRFYVNYESLRKTQNGFQGEKLGIVKTAEPLPNLPKGVHYSNPRISYDGKYWYLSVGYEAKSAKESLTEERIGIDVGVKELAVCSNGKRYKNINKTKRVKQLEKKLRREQRSLARMLLQNVEKYKIVKGYPVPVWKRSLRDCKNMQKQKKVIRLLYRTLANIRKNYTHHVTTEIVKTKPSRIVMETLNVKGMMKNRHLADAIAKQSFYEWKRQIKYKCERAGILLVEADRWFPSSKKCSCCGQIKKNFKLSDRIYHCEVCGLVIDRDLNASINLANYKLV